MKLSDRVNIIPGIGLQKARALNRLDIRSVNDLLFLLPRRYEDWTSPNSPAALREGEALLVRARVIRHERVPLRRGRPLLKIIISDGRAEASLVCFNRDFLETTLPPGTDLLVYGKFRFRYGEWQCSSFSYEKADAPSRSPFMPVYPLTGGLLQQHIRNAVLHIFQEIRDFGEIVPDYLAEKRQLGSYGGALKTMHFPDRLSSVHRAREVLAYRELLLFECLILYRRARTRQTNKERVFRKDEYIARAEHAFGFQLTGGQREAASAILGDLYSVRPMQRMVIGDVGSGKTAVAALALLAAVSSGYQAAVVAPTLVLARQLHERISAYLPEFRVNFYSGALSAGERKKQLQAMQSGECHVAVGTHALFYDRVMFASLGLVVIDEEHRFGVRQRRQVRNKGMQVDYLSMSATPIPRSLAMSLYGDMDISFIRELPAGRQPVETHWAARNNARVYAEVQKAAARGEQAYLVFPLIDEDDEGAEGDEGGERGERGEENRVATVAPAAQQGRLGKDGAGSEGLSGKKPGEEQAVLRSAVEAMEKLPEKELAGLKVALLHGRMNDEEKVEVMESFRSGAVQVLVATTVIEVGVDNPRATVMVIHEAQRFGLSQLHQLRGRIGRGEWPSQCFLLGPSRPGEMAKARIRLLAESRDGFTIAREDLKLRGPGELFGKAQSGLPRFVFADIIRDQALLETARQDALFIINKDPGLEHPANKRLRSYCRQVLERSEKTGIGWESNYGG